MTEERASALILLGCLISVAVGIFGLAALGVRGPGLSLGALVPLGLAANAVSRVVVHYGSSRRRSR